MSDLGTKARRAFWVVAVAIAVASGGLVALLFLVAS